jgi:UDP-N-acetylmuramyl pentapeptide synthase
MNTRTEIGVIGSDEVADALNELYEMTEEPAVTVRRLDESSVPRRFSVLIINGAGAVAARFVNELEPGDAVVVNADNKQIYRYLGGCRGRLITYGFSSKACVTASSVIGQPLESIQSIQLCIQRALPTLTGDVHEPQEFSVTFKSPKNIYCALGAVTAALIAGMPAEVFSEAVLKPGSRS